MWKDEMISVIESMIENMAALSCDSFEFMKAYGYSLFQSEESKHLVRNVIKIVEKKRPLLIEMKS